ncbi:hypothetical protein GUJ93_ZPchr0003g18362 [Zizania palustris]|uniref:Uncharacterized protein n=1 Tax=Zizania palustris TaxID=103762 RepID=A0A8J5S9Q8_ZIZPA|nr:hypothetical protein GUJ93_ZPchr0003g18362 [Zizania palustris]
MSRRSEEIYVRETTLRRLAVVGGATSTGSAVAAVRGTVVRYEATTHLEKWSLREKGWGQGNKVMGAENSYA